MKAATLIVFVALVAAVFCRPDLKSPIEERTSKGGTCSTNIEDCASAPFSVICASRPGEHGKSFGSTCALNVYNCLHKESLKVISSGKCPGASGH